MKRTVIASAVTFAAGVILGSTFIAEPRSTLAVSNGQRVCVDKKTGVMRLASVKSCTTAERATVFGGQGPAGSKGDTGAAGPKGDTGPAGAQAPAGSDATVKTKLVTISYLGATTSGNTKCGSGTSSISSSLIYNSIFFDISSLTSPFSWKSVSNCSITVAVIDE